MALSTVRLALVTLGSVVYLGLAVLGWGGLRAFLSHPTLAALAIAFLALSSVALLTPGNLSQGCARVAETVGSSWLLPWSDC